MNAPLPRPTFPDIERAFSEGRVREVRPAIQTISDASCSVTLIDASQPEGRAALRAWSAPRPGERKPPYDLSADLANYAAAVAEENAEMAARPVLMSAAEMHQRVAARMAAQAQRVAS